MGLGHVEQLQLGGRLLGSAIVTGSGTGYVGLDPVNLMVKSWLWSQDDADRTRLCTDTQNDREWQTMYKLHPQRLISKPIYLY